MEIPVAQKKLSLLLKVILFNLFILSSFIIVIPNKKFMFLWFSIHQFISANEAFHFSKTSFFKQYFRQIDVPESVNIIITAAYNI